MNSLRHNIENTRKKRISNLEYRLQGFCEDVKNFKFENSIDNQIKELDKHGILKTNNLLISDKNNNKHLFEKIDVYSGDFESDNNSFEIKNQNDKIVNSFKIAYKSNT